MTPELWTTLVGGVVLFLGNLGVFFKTKADVTKIHESRAASKIERDKDSLELHDAVRKAAWEIDSIKATAGHRDQVIDQLQAQMAILNSTMATTNVKLDTLTEVIKELKELNR
jgi:peptidoglycan hydrolase CwlO-like protein